MDLISEITTRVAEIHPRVQPVPPLLMLGTSERVGSNWLSDTLGATLTVHNEPLRQQLDASHPLSALNPHPRTLTGLRDDLGPLGRHALVVAATAKYALTGQHRCVVKETNLYGGIGLPLGLWPDAPIVVASRSPLGVVSSFRRGGLFHRFGYPATYQHLAALTRTNPLYQRWAPLFPDDQPSELTALVRLIVVNAALLAEAIAGRPGIVHVPYEAAVTDQGAALTRIAALIGQPISAWPSATAEPSGDDTFATAAPRRLIAHLDQRTAQTVRAITAALLDRLPQIVPAAVAATTREWLAGADRYQLRLPQRLTPQTAAPRAVAGGDLRARWLERADIRWRTLLVGNDEFAAFLNALAVTGQPNTMDGTHLLFVPMPAGRGGRLHLRDGRWTATTGYGTHPVYWVTWIGAAAFAAWTGARLPLRAEYEQLIDEIDPTAGNTGYRVGDVTSVIEPGRSGGELHHPAGNVMTWCADGPETEPAARWYAGSAWNTPGGNEQLHRSQHRHITGASRGIGIRLVQAHTEPATPQQITDRIRAWIGGLSERDTPLAALDEQLIWTLQPDVRLEAGIAPSVRKA